MPEPEIKPKIYLWAITFEWGRGHQDYLACALAEDGHGLCSHMSSTIGWAKHDVGLTSSLKHDLYSKYYPEGYQLIWLDKPEKDEGWKEAMKMNKKIAKELEKAEKNK